MVLRNQRTVLAYGIDIVVGALYHFQGNSTFLTNNELEVASACLSIGLVLQDLDDLEESHKAWSKTYHTTLCHNLDSFQNVLGLMQEQGQ